MEQHKYHSFFIPILVKLFKEGKQDEFIDVSDCFTGTPQQNAAIFRNLNQSEFAVVKKEARVLKSSKQYDKPARFYAMILPLGVEYMEKFIEEFKESQIKRPPIGFKTNN